MKTPAAPSAVLVRIARAGRRPPGEQGRLGRARAGAISSGRFLIHTAIEACFLTIPCRERGGKGRWIGAFPNQFSCRLFQFATQFCRILFLIAHRCDPRGAPCLGRHDETGSRLPAGDLRQSR